MSLNQGVTQNSSSVTLSSYNTSTVVVFPCLSDCSSPGDAQGGPAMEDTPYFRWVKVVMASLVTMVILASNTVNMMALYRMREIGPRMKVLLMSLSTSDLCLGLFVCMPGVVSGIMSRWPFGPVMCQITGTMNGVAISVSLWSLMAIGVERYLVMRRFSVSKTKKNSHIVGACVAFIWSFNTLFFALPIAWEPGHLYYRYDPDVLTCSFMWKYTWHFMTAKFLYPILSGTVIVCTSWQVNQVLKRAERARKQWMISSGSRVRQRKKEQEGPVSQQKSPTKQGEDKAKGKSSASRHSRSLNLNLDQSRISASKSLLLLRNFDQRRGSSPLSEKQLRCPSTYQNGCLFPTGGTCVVIGEDGRPGTHMTESSADALFKASENQSQTENGKCVPPIALCPGKTSISSPLSENDLTLDVGTKSTKAAKTSTSAASRSVSGDYQEKRKTEDSSDSRDHDNHMRIKTASKLNLVESSAPTDNKTHINSNAKRFILSLNFSRLKKIGNKKLRFHAAEKRRSLHSEDCEQSVGPLTAPVSKSFLRRQRKAKALLLITTMVFFIATSPYMINSLLEHFLPGLGLPSWLRFLSLWTLCTNSLINVFIYSAVYAEFRGYCKQLFRSTTCRENKIKEQQPMSAPTSSVYELFAVRTKAENSVISRNTGSSDSDNTKGQSQNGNDDSLNGADTSTSLKTFDICVLTSSSSMDQTTQRPSGTQHHLQLPLPLVSNRCLTPRLPTTEIPGVMEVLPQNSVQPKLQPRDDIGMFAGPEPAPLLLVGSSVAPTTSFSHISPSISQSTSCSLDSFAVEMMPSVDV